MQPKSPWHYAFYPTVFVVIIYSPCLNMVFIFLLSVFKNPIDWYVKLYYNTLLVTVIMTIITVKYIAL